MVHYGLEENWNVATTYEAILQDVDVERCCNHFSIHPKPGADHSQTMALICGFNEFGQLNHFRDCSRATSNKTIGSPETISGLKFSWNYCVSKSGDDFYVSGFVGGMPNSKRKLVLPAQERIYQVACSKRHCLVLTVAGQCWKYTLLNEQWTDLTTLLFTEDTTNAKVTHISSSETQNIAITSSGWIYNIPSRISFLQQVADVTCGKEHCVLLTTVGKVFTWGAGSRGQLGHGNLEPEEEPREIEALVNLNVIKIAAGGWHTWILTEDDKLYSWGWNSNGQLAYSLLECKVQAEPRSVNRPTETVKVNIKVNKVACGSRHTVILLSNGLLYGCGWNNYGQLFLPITTTDSDKLIKLPVSGDFECQDIICGSWNTAALRGDVHLILKK